MTDSTSTYHYFSARSFHLAGSRPTGTDMATLTLDLIRKKAEHHTDSLASLQELSLHQLNLAHLTPLLSQACPHLRILYLHNNLLPSHPTFRQLHRLKSLTYLNLTLNNITTLPAPHLAALEKLVKLDLTLNHISLTSLTDSLHALVPCHFLIELYLTGNPCTRWTGYRQWVVGRLVRLERLDGTDVTRTERLEAQQQSHRLAEELQLEIERERKEEEEREHKQVSDEKEPEGAANSDRDTRFTPALRLRMYEEQQAAEAKQQAEAAASASRFHSPADLYTQAKHKLNTFLDPADYSHASLPSQRNVGRYPFTLTAPTATMHCVVLRVEVPRHMDTSSVRVDVQPWWVQVDIRGQLLVLHTGEEVEVGGASVKRVVSDGSLVVRMPVVRKEAVAREAQGESEEEDVVEEAKRETEQVVVLRAKGKNGKAVSGWEAKVAQSEKKQAEESTMDKAVSVKAAMTELSATRSVTLEAKRQMEQKAVKQRQMETQRKVHVAFDDDDVPPLI